MGITDWFMSYYSYVGLKGVVLSIVLLIGMMFILALMFFRKYAGAMLMDILIDGGISFADNFLFGAGAVGIDIGDVIAGIMLYKREVGRVGKLWASVIFLEACNFGLGLIPVIGEVFEVIFGLIPSATIIRAKFDRTPIAEARKKKLHEDSQLAEKTGFGDCKSELHHLQRFDKMIDKDPINYLKETEGIARDINSKVTGAVQNYIADTQGLLSNMASQEVDEELAPILQQAVSQVQSALAEAQALAGQNKFKEAVEQVDNAKAILADSVSQYNMAEDKLYTAEEEEGEHPQ